VAIGKSNGASSHGREGLVSASLLAKELFPQLVLHGGGEGLGENWTGKGKELTGLVGKERTGLVSTNNLVIVGALVATPAMLEGVCPSLVKACIMFLIALNLIIVGALVATPAMLKRVCPSFRFLVSTNNLIIVGALVATPAMLEGVCPSLIVKASIMLGITDHLIIIGALVATPTMLQVKNPSLRHIGLLDLDLVVGTPTALDRVRNQAGSLTEIFLRSFEDFKLIQGIFRARVCIEKEREGGWLAVALRRAAICAEFARGVADAKGDRGYPGFR